MIITLPKHFNSAILDLDIPQDDPLFKVTLIKGGVLLYNMVGVLIGQIFVGEKTSTAVIADGASIKIDVSESGDYIITVPSYSNADKKKLLRPESERKLRSEFIVFGKPAVKNYKLFEKKQGEIQPNLVATVITAPLEDSLRVKIDDESNILRVITIILAINLI